MVFKNYFSNCFVFIGEGKLNRNKIYCKGILCRKSERKKKCCDCNRYVCKRCSIELKNKVYCIDCFVEYHLVVSEHIINDFLFSEDRKLVSC